MKLSKKRIKELETEIELRVYNQGHYRLMSESHSIEAEYDEDSAEDYIEEREEGENLRLPFKITHNKSECDRGSSEWWNIVVEVDADYKILKLGE